MMMKTCGRGSNNGFEGPTTSIFMKFGPIIKFLLVLSLILAGTCQAIAASNDGLVPTPPLKEHVTDMTGTLTTQEQNELNSILSKFEKKKGSQIAVLIIPTTKPEEIEKYSLRVANQWGLGRKNINDGVLLLIAKDDKRLRIEVGYGLEDVLSNPVAKEIIDKTIVPYFKNGDFYNGIKAGLGDIIKIVNDKPLPPPLGIMAEIAR